MAADRRRRLLLLAAAGLAVVLVFRMKAPRGQTVRLVLGAKAASVSAIDAELREPGASGESLRRARFAFDPGRAPRVVTWEVEAPDGAYATRFEVETREGRRTVEREVTLAGGATSIDLVDALP